MKLSSLLLIALLIAAQSVRASIYEKTPAQPDPSAQYIIYLHGAIIESMGRRPTHPRFGVYEYDQVLNALDNTGAHVISETRPKGTKVQEYAVHVVKQIKSLKAANIPSQNITVVGFSKGGMIALRSSHLMDDPNLNFVFLAACNPGNRKAGLKLSGRTLSIIETTDKIGTTCLPFKDTAKNGMVMDQVVINTGKMHGAFYQPDERWLTPLKAWMLKARDVTQ